MEMPKPQLCRNKKGGLDQKQFGIRGSKLLDRCVVLRNQKCENDFNFRGILIAHYLSQKCVLFYGNFRGSGILNPKYFYQSGYMNAVFPMCFGARRILDRK